MKQDELQALIHSLGIAERRYFSLFSGLFGKGKYLDLYQKLDAGPGGQGDAATRHYLQNMILKCLRAYHSGRSAEMQFREAMSDVEILFSRGSFNLAAKQLRLLKKSVYEQEAFSWMPLVAAWERRLLKRSPGRDRLARLDAIQQAEIQTARENADEIRLHYLNDRLYLQAQIESEGMPGTEEILAALPADESRVPTFEGKIVFHFIQAFAAQKAAQPGVSLPHFERIVELWQTHPARAKQHPDRFALSIADYLANCHQLGDYSNFSRLLEAAAHIRFSDNTSSARAERTFFNLELLYCMNTGRAAEGETLVSEKGERLTGVQVNIPLSTRLAFWTNFAILYFMRENFSRSLYWVNQILNQPLSEDREDLRRFCLILRCVLHYELQNNDLFVYLLKSTRRQLRPWLRKNEFGNTLILFLSKLADTPEAEKRDEFRKADQQMNAYEKPGEGMNEIRIWIHARAGGRKLDWQAAR